MWWQRITTRLLPAQHGAFTARMCATTTSSGPNAIVTKDWRNLDEVRQELRHIAQEHGLENRMPSTLLLKDLGHASLVQAIRKKHGGFVQLAQKLGYTTEAEDVEIQKKLSSRTNRRKKRQQRIEQHKFY